MFGQSNDVIYDMLKSERFCYAVKSRKEMLHKRRESVTLS